MRIQLPLPLNDNEKLTAWARRLVASLVRTFEEVNPVLPTGVVVQWPEGVEPPEEFLILEGGEYKVSTYPALGRLLNSETTPGFFSVPDLTSEFPTGLVLLIKT